MSKNQKSGLNIKLGNQCSSNAFEWAKKSFQNRANKSGAIQLKSSGAFSNVLQFGNQKIGIASDGIGTKIELAERTGIYNTIAFDLVAMVVDDLATTGLEATSISNILDVDMLDYKIIDQLMEGLHNAANFANISVTGGEIAELGNRINGWGGAMHFNWCSTAIGVLPSNLSEAIDGQNVQEGDHIISLQSDGFRSNGYSLLRSIMHKHFGEYWHNEKYNDEQSWGEKLLRPSLIYTPGINQLVANNIIPNAIVHVTGGGIAENLARVIEKKRLGANLFNLFEPLDVMQAVIKLDNINYKDAYQYWNMGNGLLIIVNPAASTHILELLQQTDYKAKLAGIVTKKEEITIEQPNQIISHKYDKSYV